MATSVGLQGDMLERVSHVFVGFTKCGTPNLGKYTYLCNPDSTSNAFKMMGSGHSARAHGTLYVSNPAAYASDPALFVLTPAFACRSAAGAPCLLMTHTNTLLSDAAPPRFRSLRSDFCSQLVHQLAAEPCGAEATGQIIHAIFMCMTMLTVQPQSHLPVGFDIVRLIVSQCVLLLRSLQTRVQYLRSHSVAC